MIPIELSPRQHQIVAYVRANEPATGDSIAAHLKLTRATIRADLSILTMTGILDARPKVGYFYSGLENNPIHFDEIRQLKVADIMTQPFFAKKETSVYDAIVMLFMEDIGSLYVVDEDQLVGLVSRKDLLKGALADADTKATPIATIMTRMPNLVTVTKNDNVLHAAEQLVFHQIDSLPVLENTKVVGKISKTRITALFVDTIKKV
ncbi:helix-turn-helix transcriptional regulator [Listeria sp. FSL L7-0233]|uniref:Helix-turn-helix transcriptional regulator n=1 Tax=Listeria cossartiae subsp. cayugensis TaxID=2713505 RepID=A0A7X1DBZ0_9LIST|nr:MULTISPECIES: helix-turn-helix transcriptional regulator [Listeria]MBC1546768.1 helix-turn-helix transcriptional regulator [Listeria cossartiae subsp. cossartiae]MBC1569257.1 helix-turn-helix transcriptional regulator [Listeria cossartiae subsp. cossartiae]MBC1806993.1 helix-turn-helix transcriptional regulator [Listeria cossartiae subsp. cayugensis]MBC2183242.1 helix-turn-helix transcriptional regulator [Listeria cossartiae subsp. cossartiae]MBC2185957.1 helix-turn-helix transcriptional re